MAPGSEGLLPWTLLGLVGCALFATLHPVPAFAVTGHEAQTGQVVEATVVVRSVTHGSSGAWGTSYAVAGNASRLVRWAWFDEAARAVFEGDMLRGRFLVEASDREPSLLARGGVTHSTGPFPVPVRWSDLVSAPERFEGRWVTVTGSFAGGQLSSPGNDMACAVIGGRPDLEEGRWVVRIERQADTLGFVCVADRSP